MDDDQVVGIISANEIFSLAAHFLGAWEKRSGVTLAPLELKPGMIGRITDIVEGAGAEVQAIYPIGKPEDINPQEHHASASSSASIAPTPGTWSRPSRTPASRHRVRDRPITEKHYEFPTKESHPMDLRYFINQCEAANELKRVSAEVDWNLEISHVSKLTEEKKGPALLFENVKGYSSPVFTGAFATTKRLAIMLGLPHHLSMCESAQAWMKKTITSEGLIKAKEVKDGPVLENIIRRQGRPQHVPGAEVLPARRRTLHRHHGVRRAARPGDRRDQPRHLPHADARRQDLRRADPARQARRAHHEEVRQAGQENAGRRRDRLRPADLHGRHADAQGRQRLRHHRHGARPARRIPHGAADRPADPAGAEIVLEGEIDPNNFRPEGPFAEYTGYYTDELHKPINKPALEVKQILHRNNPVLWATGQGRPVTDVHMLLAFTRTATLWTELEKMKIPGISRFACCPNRPAASGPWSRSSRPTPATRARWPTP
jgi:hypothetical protein